MASSQNIPETLVEVDKLTQDNIVRAVELGLELPHWPPSLARMGLRPMIFPKRDFGIKRPKQSVSPRTRLQIAYEIGQEIRAELARRAAHGHA